MYLLPFPTFSNCFSYCVQTSSRVVSIGSLAVHGILRRIRRKLINYSRLVLNFSGLPFAKRASCSDWNRSGSLRKFSHVVSAILSFHSRMKARTLDSVVRQGENSRLPLRPCARDALCHSVRRLVEGLNSSSIVLFETCARFGNPIALVRSVAPTRSSPVRSGAVARRDSRMRGAFNSSSSSA